MINQTIAEFSVHQMHNPLFADIDHVPEVPGDDRGQCPFALKVGRKLVSPCIPRYEHLPIPLLARGRNPEGI